MLVMVLAFRRFGVSAFRRFGVSAVGVWRCNNRPPPAASRGGSSAPRLAPGGWRQAAGAKALFSV